MKGTDVYHITIIKLNTNIITKEYIEESLDNKLFIRKNYFGIHFELKKKKTIFCFL